MQFYYLFKEMEITQHKNINHGKLTLFFPKLGKEPNCTIYMHHHVEHIFVLQWKCSTLKKCNSYHAVQ